MPARARTGSSIQSPLGQPLLVARVTAEAIHETRARWRGNISALVLGILALTLIVAVPPLLRWREAFPKLKEHLNAVGVILAMLVAARVAAVVRAHGTVDRSGISTRPRSDRAFARCFERPSIFC